MAELQKSILRHLFLLVLNVKTDIMIIILCVRQIFINIILLILENFKIKL